MGIGKIGMYAAEKIAAKVVARDYVKNAAKVLNKGALKGINFDGKVKVAKFDFEKIPEIKLPKKSLLEKVYESLLKLKGTEGSFTLTKTQLRLVPTKNKPFLKEFLKRTKNPKIKISYKSTEQGSGYTVAGVRFMDGKSVIGTGAVSMTNPGAANNVIKARLSLGRKGEAVTANAFLDGGKSLNALTDDIALNVSRKAGKFQAQARYGDMYGANIQVAPESKEFRRIARLTGKEQEVNKLTQDFQKRTTDFMAKINDKVQHLLKK